MTIPTALIEAWISRQPDGREHTVPRGLPAGRYPYKNPLYVRTGTVSEVDGSQLRVTYDDGTVSGWIPFDETARATVGLVLSVAFKDAARTVPFPLIRGRGAYRVEARQE